MNESLFRQVGPYIIVDPLDETERRGRSRAVGLRHGPALHFMLRTYHASTPEELREVRAAVHESAAAARGLDHPNLCANIEHGDLDDGVYSVSSFIAGKTLERILEELRSRGMRLPAPVALYIAHQLCAGLSFLHTLTDRSGTPLNLTMGNLAPSAVLIGYEGDVRILDGLPLPSARIGLELPGVEAAYLSPERARGRTPDPRSDIYAVGMVLYEILTLRSPFRRPNAADSRAAVLGATLLTPSELTPGIDRKVDALVMRALHRDPAQRFADAWDMEEAVLELGGAVELRRSRGVLAGVLNTIFGDSREAERIQLRSVVEALDRAGRFERSGPPAGPDRASDSAVGARAKVEAPKVEAPKVEAPKVEAPKVASPRISAHGEAPQTAQAEPLRRVSAHGEAPQTAQAEPLRRVSAHGEGPRRVSAHGEGPPKPAPAWRLPAAALGALVLAAGVLFALRPGADPAPAARPGDAVIARLVAEHPAATDPGGAAADQGWISLLDGSFDAQILAREAFERALVNDPLSVPAIAGLALVYATLPDNTHALDAAELLARAESIDPAAPATRHARIGMKLAANDAAGALDAARSCLAELPEDPRCTWYEGLALRALDRGAEALDPLERAAASLPRVSGVAVVIGETARSVGEYSRARAALEAALAIAPNEAALHLALARLRQQGGDAEAALTHCERALERDPTAIEARALRGALLLHALDRPAEAARVLQPLATDPLLEKSPLQHEVLIRTAWALAAADLGAEALPLARLAHQSAPDDPAARLALAMALDATGDGEGAESLIRGTSFDGADARAMARLRYHAARLYIRHGRERFAQPLLEDALEQDPGWTTASIALAEVLWRTGDTDAALARLGEMARWALGPDLRDPLGLAPPAAPATAWLQDALAARLRDRQDGVTLRAAGVLMATRCLAAGACTEARARLREALAADPGDTASASLHARLLQHDGKNDDALAQLQALAGQESPELSLTLALVRSALGHHTEADAAFNAALSARPTATVYRLYAQALLARGEADRAREAARKALALEPGDMPSVALLSL